ncbi:hypothetical protein JAAARDRAFT_430272 [Jaapia argillacea MUCL 33604]|uniref:Uncharacterized protein n=1 Tax=Jaapia argillacea MUCL 33604 TaxID=933084 RepID=A0A067PQN0_9AGAM|nr:hypothetical protein JAAARDRAFT_430272 [Jaapia argillacea MUCL 33604]
MLSRFPAVLIVLSLTLFLPFVVFEYQNNLHAYLPTLYLHPDQQSQLHFQGEPISRPCRYHLSYTSTTPRNGEETTSLPLNLRRPNFKKIDSGDDHSVKQWRATSGLGGKSGYGRVCCQRWDWWRGSVGVLKP